MYLDGWKITHIAMRIIVFQERYEILSSGFGLSALMRARSILFDATLVFIKYNIYTICFNPI
jgi:hypothetical protein